ncbi:MAG: fumarate hydratase [Pseudomonadota bacterium]
MREIATADITAAVSRLAVEANRVLGDDVLGALSSALGLEESDAGRDVLQQLLDNARIAREQGLPLCQDTGFAIVFAEVGQEARIIGGGLAEAINEGVRRGYREGYLRTSICDPLTRKNTGDNTPAVIHTEIVPGDGLKLTFVAKGGGSENMSRVTMLAPAAGLAGIEDFVVRRVEESGSNPCPPIIVGVGVGGTFEKCALLAKKALLREVGSPHPEARLAEIERRLLARINNLGIGPQGLGGRMTALAVQLEMMPCHIASLPVAVNIQCHSARHKSIIL